MGLAKENLPKQGACMVTGLLYTWFCGAGGKSVGLIAPISYCVCVCLRNAAFCSSELVVSNFRIVSYGGKRPGLIRSIIAAFAWRNRGKPLRNCQDGRSPGDIQTEGRAE
jgi:hypothetical protein